MEFHFAYYVIFIVSLGGCAIGAPPSEEDADTEIRKICAFKNLTSGSRTISSENACLSFTKRALAFFEQCPKEGESRGKADLRIKYKDIDNVEAQDGTVKIKHGSTETALQMDNPALFSEQLKQLARADNSSGKSKGGKSKSSKKDAATSASEN